MTTTNTRQADLGFIFRTAEQIQLFPSSLTGIDFKTTELTFSDIYCSFTSNWLQTIGWLRDGVLEDKRFACPSHARTQSLHIEVHKFMYHSQMTLLCQ